MIIDKIHITKFHGFKNVGFKLGSNITIIAGQNGTQKTTLLGLLGQPFSLRLHPEMSDEKPLCGGSYWSQYADKFKLSPTYDKKGEHEWTIESPLEKEPYTVESIYRDKGKGIIRFWKKGTHEKDSGYLRYPVIYLSLKRLIPIGEDPKIHSKNESFTEEEIKLFKELHNKILISFDRIVETSVIEGSNKTTLGITTDLYDWMQNSAGQDNVGKIILALLSFKRLSEKYGKTYKGGVLLIDELDATMYPGSQERLLKILRRFSQKYRIQIVFTTHSLMLLEIGSRLYNETRQNPKTANQIQLIYLEKLGDTIDVLEGASFHSIRNRLRVNTEDERPNKVTVYSEDLETIWVAKSLLKGNLSRLSFITSPFSCNTLIDLLERKIPTFTFPESIIFFDGDVSADVAQQKKLKKIKSNNWLYLPTNLSPERWFASFISKLDSKDSFWSTVHPDYTFQVCFKDYNVNDIMAGGESGRQAAKAWFRQQVLEHKGWVDRVLNRWKKDSSENNLLAQRFVEQFIQLFNRIASSVRITPIEVKDKKRKK